MIKTFDYLCTNAIVDMHSIVASRLINIQEIDASQDYCLHRGMLLPSLVVHFGETFLRFTYVLLIFVVYSLIVLAT